MKIKNMNILILGLFIALSACGKHALPKKEEEKKADTAPPAASTAGDAEKAAAEKAEAPKDFTVVGEEKGKETLYSKVFSKFSDIKDKVTVADVTLPLAVEDLANKDVIAVAVVGTFGDDNKVTVDKSLLSNPKLWSTSMVQYSKADKKIAVLTTHELKIKDLSVIGDKSVVVKDVVSAADKISLTKKQTDEEKKAGEVKPIDLGILPSITVDVTKLLNLELDLSQTPVAGAIAFADGSEALAKGTDCFVVVPPNAKNTVAPAGLMLSKIIKDKSIDFSGLKAADLAKFPTDNKPMDAFFICGDIGPAGDLTKILFTQKAIKLTIKAAPAAPAAKPATPKQ